MITDIDAIKNVCEKIRQKKIEDAKKIINDRCPFIPPIEKEERISFSEEYLSLIHISEPTRPY